MKLLLDTCTFLWIAAGSAEVSPGAKRLFLNRENEVYLSVVSAWEICIKHALGRLPLPEAPTEFIPEQRRAHGIRSLSLDEAATLGLDGLAGIHADPFDRMLVCQAIAGDMSILTPDAAIRSYRVKTIW